MTGEITTTTTNTNTKTASSSSTSGSNFDERNLAATDVKAAEDKIQSLCVSHAATFVAVERRGAALTSSLHKLLSVLDDARPKVEESKECLEIDNNSVSGGEEEGTQHKQRSTLAVLAEKHKMRRRTLLQHSSLLELLEMPSLMDACVRGHLYEEGLSIASFANSLEAKHLNNSKMGSSGGAATDADDHHQQQQQGNPIVTNVVKEIRKREVDLRRHLLHRLRSDVTMPQCLEVVTALRRLNGVELERLSRDNATGINVTDLEKIHEAMEWRLQVNFLEARDVWLDGYTTGVSNSATTLGMATQSSRKLGKRILTSNNSDQMLDNIDLYRTRCFEIATQFLAIFRSSTGKTWKSKSTASSDKASQLLSMWTSRRIDSFLHQQLSLKYLPLISDTATLRDTLESVTFFATSMGRIGADFSPLIPDIFVPHLTSIVTLHWTDGLNTLQDTLKVCREAGIATPLYNSREIISPIGNNDDDEEGDVIAGVGTKTSSPPRQLLSLPPLARLVNSFLTGLNELRRCLLSTAFPLLRLNYKENFVVKVKEILIENERAVMKPGFLSKGEEAGKLRSLAAEMKEEFDSCVQPYLSTALEVALGTYDSIIQNNNVPGNENIPMTEEKEEGRGDEVIDVIDNTLLVNETPDEELELRQTEESIVTNKSELED